MLTISPKPLALSLAAAAVLLGGCSMTESRVRQQIAESEARSAAAQTQLEDRMIRRFANMDQVLNAAVELLRREMADQGEAQRRLVMDGLVRQRDSLSAQLRVLDDAISTLAMPRPLPAPLKPMP